MVTNSESAATQIVDALMENRETELTKDFLFLDPKVVKPSGVSSTVPKGRAPFDEGLVFMVGGGNFNEYVCVWFCLGHPMRACVCAVLVRYRCARNASWFCGQARPEHLDSALPSMAPRCAWCLRGRRAGALKLRCCLHGIVILRTAAL